MIPTKLKQFHSQNTTQKMYDHYSSHVQCVPRSNSHYAMQYWNEEAFPDPRPPNYKPHDEKIFHLNKYFNQALLNSTIGEQIIDYEYKPKTGFIKNPRKCHQPYIDMTCQFPHAPPSRAQFSFSDVNKRYEFNSKNESSLYDDCAYNYVQLIENPNMWKPAGFTTDIYTPQPQIHIGMSAIPQLNPSTELATFLKYVSLL